MKPYFLIQITLLAAIAATSTACFVAHAQTKAQTPKTVAPSSLDLVHDNSVPHDVAGQAIARGLATRSESDLGARVDGNEVRLLKLADVTPSKVAAADPPLRYRLAEGSENWPAGKKAEIVAAMDEAVAFYNATGHFDKQIIASYNASVPTADGNFNGNIRFGKQISSRTALHEIGHILGVGTVRKWRELVVDGKWTGKNALAQLRAFDGPDAVLYADRQHFWPYGLNFDREDVPDARRRHVLMVAALRADLGLNGDEPFVLAK